MKTIKLFFIFMLLFVAGYVAEANAQGWLKYLGEKAEGAAKRSVERKVEEKVEKAVDDAFDKAEEQARQDKKKRNENPVIKEPVDRGIPASDTFDWDSNDPYYALKKGSKIVYTVYDGKGRVQGYNNQEIIEISRTKNKVKAVVSGTRTDRKGKVESAAAVDLRYDNGNFHVNMLEMLPPKGMENMDVDAQVSGKDLLIPAKLTPEQMLPDAEMTFKVKMKSEEASPVDFPPVTFRVFNRRAVRAESVNTPVGKFVCFKIIQTLEVDLPFVGKQLSTNITWIGKGMGVVKTEIYDRKGKLQVSMLLTEFQ